MPKDEDVFDLDELKDTMLQQTKNDLNEFRKLHKLNDEDLKIAESVQWDHKQIEKAIFDCYAKNHNSGGANGQQQVELNVTYDKLKPIQDYCERYQFFQEFCGKIIYVDPLDRDDVVYG